MKKITLKLNARLARAVSAIGIVVLTALVPLHTAHAFLGWFNETFSSALASIVNGVLSLMGVILWTAGVFLNFVVSETVINMASWVKDINGINVAWGVLRDIANIGFIFALLFIGVATILRLENYNMKRLLSGLIVAALLINFSMFFTKVVIDTSNILAVQFYKAMAIPNCTNNLGGGVTTTVCDGGLSDQFMNALKVTTLYDAEGKNNDIGEDSKKLKKKEKGMSAWNIFFTGVFGSIYILVVAFIFFAAAILLSIRFVILIILMVLSPIGFAASVLPATSGYAKQWWSTLFRQAFFAPAYFLLTYISLLIITSSKFIPKGDAHIASAASGDASALGTTLFNFLIITTFMVASLIIANKLGVSGAGSMMKIGNNLRKWGQGVAGGATFRNAVARPLGATSRAYSQIDTALEKTRRGRNAKRVISALTFGAIGGKRPLIPAIAKAAAEKQFLGGTSLVGAKKEAHEYKQASGVVEREDVLKGIMKKLANGLALNSNELRAFRQSTIKELEKIKAGSLATRTAAGQFTEKQIDDIGKSEVFTEQEKKKIKDERREYFRDEAGVGRIGAIIINMKAADVAKLPADVLTQYNTTEHLRPGHLSEMTRELSDVDRATIRANIVAAVAAGGPAAVAGGWADRLATWLKTPAGQTF